MARRKQSVPTRAKATTRPENSADLNNTAAQATAKPRTKHDFQAVTIYSPVIAVDSVIDIAAVNLEAAVYKETISHLLSTDRQPLDVRLHLLNAGRDSLVALHALSVDDVQLEVFQHVGNKGDGLNADKALDLEPLISGYLDCTDTCISAFVYLFKSGFIAAKPLLHVDTQEERENLQLSCAIKIGITEKTFDGCDGLLDGGKSLWSRSMLKVMKWLRPDLHSQESIYGISEVKTSNFLPRSCFPSSECAKQDPEGRSQQAFDPSLLYEAIKPNQNTPTLGFTPPKLVAKLRPYQSRAAYWMLMREKAQSFTDNHDDQMKWPFSMEVASLDKKTTFFYNPFSGALSKIPIVSFLDVRGGILADEMGLGKTVELLACIMANPFKSTSQQNDSAMKASEELDKKLSKRKYERVACPCGAETDDYYDGIWVQCDICDAWQHASCVGFGLEYECLELFEKERGWHKGEWQSCKKTKLEKRKANTQEETGSCQKTKTKKRKSDTREEILVKEQRYMVNQDFVCGGCAKLIGSVEVQGISGTTLIVCPPSILGQWQEEITRHTEKGALKVIVYEGFQRGIGLQSDQTKGSKYGKVVGAHELAAADIVLTTYSTLQADLSHDMDGDYNQQRAMRYIKRYPVLPTPLTRLKWWRVCLDEAQMVESSSARATEMAKRLNSEIRWCITGTPIQHGLDDLHGLLNFIDLEPFNDSFLWARVLREPYERNECGAISFAHNYLKRVMWRSAKAHVSHELGLPPQEEILTWLTFSPVEAHFYRRQHERCAKKALEALSGCIMEKYDDRTLSHAEAVKIMHPLLSLRQACCHPQVGSSGLRSLQKHPMTMDEVLKVLIEKAKTEGEEAQRSLVGALNGLAALKVLEHDLAAAVNLYREALSVTEENAEEFDVDPLQKLHILHNLQEVLNTKVQRSEENLNALAIQKISELSLYACGVSRTLRDGLLEQECQDVSAKFMSSFLAKLSSSRRDYLSAHNEAVQHLKDLEAMKGANWWLDALASLPNDSRTANELVKKIKTSLLEKDELSLSRRGHENASSLALRFHDLNGLRYIINRELDAIFDHRKMLLDKISDIEKMMANPSAEEVERAANCSQCDHSQMGPLCSICEVDQVYQMYENRLFLLKSSAANVGGVVSLEDAFLAQQRLMIQKRLNTIKMAGGSTRITYESLDMEAMRNKATEIADIRVNRSPSETEVILKLIKTNLKRKMGQDLFVASTKHLDLLEAMRKEYAQARLLAMSQRMVLRALDELNMAKTRLRFKFPGEESSHKSADIFKLHPEELPQRNAQLTGEKFIALDDLRRAKGQFRYLKGLAVSRQNSMKVSNSTSSELNNGERLAEEMSGKSCEKKGLGAVAGIAEENCPVCQDHLGLQMMLLPCGHALCCKCLMTMVESDAATVSHTDRKKIACPTCRYRTLMDNIAFIDNGLGATFYGIAMDKLQDKDSNMEEASIAVNGSYGTKMEALIRRILRVQASDSSSRFLVFSSWNDVLDVVAHSLAANKIGFVRAKGQRHVGAAIRKFKAKDETARILLLLVQQGANGLNLTEAQHVILVEPLLNPGAEAQAINRVHRIGQPYATYVHRFLIKDTVEESIYKLSQLKSSASMLRKGNQDVSGLTVRDLKMLFENETEACGTHLGNYQTETTSSQVDLRELPPAAAAAAAAEARLSQVQYGMLNNLSSGC